MLPSITKRFMKSFSGGIWGEVTDRRVEAVALIVGALAIVIRSGLSLRKLLEGWHESLSIGVTIVCFLVVWHAFRSAYAVSKEVEHEEQAARSSSLTQKPLRIISPSGQPIVPEPLIVQGYSLPRVKLYGIALCLTALAVCTFVFTWKLGERGVAGIDQSAKYRPAQPPPTPPTTPIVESTYNLNFFGLPIPIPPYSKITLILITQDAKAILLDEVNTKGRTLAWPTTETLEPPQPVGQITLSIQGNSGVFDLQYSIIINVESAKDGSIKSQAPVSLPPIDLPSVGSSVTFNVVNESLYAIVVGFPGTGSASVGGNTQNITVRSRYLTGFDKLRALPPTYHRWSRDHIVDPQRKGPLFPTQP